MKKIIGSFALISVIALAGCYNDASQMDGSGGNTGGSGGNGPDGCKARDAGDSCTGEWAECGDLVCHCNEWMTSNDPDLDHTCNQHPSECKAGTSCTEGATCNDLACKCGIWVDADSADNFTCGSGTGTGGGTPECVQRTAWVHYFPDNTSLIGRQMKAHWWTNTAEDYCTGYFLDASVPDSQKVWACLAVFCQGDNVGFSIELEQDGGVASTFAFDMCDDPGKQCSGQGDNCSTIVGGSHASIWWTTDEPDNDGETFWMRGNSGPSIGDLVDNNDGLSCTDNGAFTMPSN